MLVKPIFPKTSYAKTLYTDLLSSNENGHAEYSLGFVACSDVHLRVEPLVLVGVHDVEDLASTGHVASHALLHGEPVAQ